MNNFVEDKIKIIMLNIKVLEKALSRKEDEKHREKLNKEYSELEKYKKSNPEFFI